LQGVYWQTNGIQTPFWEHNTTLSTVLRARLANANLTRAAISAHNRHRLQSTRGAKQYAHLTSILSSINFAHAKGCAWPNFFFFFNPCSLMKRVPGFYTRKTSPCFSRKRLLMDAGSHSPVAGASTTPCFPPATKTSAIDALGSGAIENTEQPRPVRPLYRPLMN